MSFGSESDMMLEFLDFLQNRHGLLLPRRNYETFNAAISGYLFCVFQRSPDIAESWGAINRFVAEQLEPERSNSVDYSNICYYVSDKREQSPANLSATESEEAIYLSIKLW